MIWDTAYTQIPLRFQDACMTSACALGHKDFSLEASVLSPRFISSVSSLLLWSLLINKNTSLGTGNNMGFQQLNEKYQ